MASAVDSFVTQQIKQRRRAFLRDLWWLHATGALLVLGGVTAIAVVFSGWWVPGWATVLFMVIAVAINVRPMVDGTYYLVGARDAERWTSRALRRMLGRAWTVIDGISFWHGDVDHIAIGPSGVYVIETKWTDSQFDLNTERSRRIAEDWVEAVQRRARSTRLLLDKDLTVEPLIVVWGSAVTGTPAICDGVRIIHRRELKAHIEGWSDRSDGLSRESVEGFGEALRAYKELVAR